MAGFDLVAVSLTAEGDAAALWADPSDAAALLGRQTDAGGASFPAERVEAGVEVRVSVQGADGRVTSSTSIVGFAFAHPRLAVLLDGTIVVAGARCSWLGSSTVPNAALFSRDGALIRRGLLGDGVASITGAGESSFWVGYFDEGIFGNSGWQPPGPGAVGAPGLVRLDRSFEVVWSYPGDSVEAIDDVPHLNLVGDVVWLTYDSGYPVARIAAGRVSVWENGTGSAFAVLVDGDTIALLSREATIGSVDGGRFVPRALADLDLPRRPIYGVARGSEYHCFGADGSWTVVALTDLMSASTPV